MPMRVSYLLVIVSLSFLFSGCGGGGGGSSAAPANSPLQTAGPQIGSATELNAMVDVPLTLDAAELSGVDDESASYAWTIDSKPANSTAQLIDPGSQQSATPQFTPDVEGDYQLTLVASDVDGKPVAQNQVNITAQPQYGTVALVFLPADMQQIARSMQGTDDGGYILSGEVSSGGSVDGFVVKTDAFGNVKWWLLAGGNGTDRFYRSIELFDATGQGNGYLFAGETDSESLHAEDTDIYLLRVDEAGQVLWEGAYGVLGDDVVKSVQALPDGSIIVSGATLVETAGQFFDGISLIKIDPATPTRRAGTSSTTSIPGTCASWAGTRRPPNSGTPW